MDRRKGFAQVLALAAGAVSAYTRLDPGQARLVLEGNGTGFEAEVQIMGSTGPIVLTGDETLDANKAIAVKVPTGGQFRLAVPTLASGVVLATLEQSPADAD